MSIENLSISELEAAIEVETDPVLAAQMVERHNALLASFGDPVELK